jgi:hypothetical protein
MGRSLPGMLLHVKREHVCFVLFKFLFHCRVRGGHDWGGNGNAMERLDGGCRHPLFHR